MEYADSWKDVKYSRLIMMTDKFIVVIDKEGDVDWSCKKSYDWDSLDLSKFNAVINKAALLEAPSRGGLDKNLLSSHKRLVAEAIARALDGDPDSADAMLKLAQDQLDARSRETSRRWYLSACFATTLPLLATGLLIWIGREKIISVIGPTAFWLLISTVAGSCGALFSVIVRSGKLVLEISSGCLLHFLEGASRIVAGAIAGGVAGLAVKSGIILGPLMHAGKPHMVVVVAATVAGSAERLASSIVSTFDSSARSNVKQKLDENSSTGIAERGTI